MTTTRIEHSYAHPLDERYAAVKLNDVLHCRDCLTEDLMNHAAAHKHGQFFPTEDVQLTDWTCDTCGKELS